MKVQNLPSISARYWSAILVASMAGANTGDFAARYLHLGHTRGLLPLALIFVVILWVEARAVRATQAYYWLAIIVLRTGATNLADLATHDLALGYGPTIAGLTALLLLILWFDHARGAGTTPSTGNAEWKLPATDVPYWVAMLTAGTLGTAAGDCVADEIGLGLWLGSLVLLVIFAIVLLLAMRIGKMSTIWYWATVVAARTAGTTLGDLVASRHGIDLGLPVSTACTLVLLAGIVVCWPDPNRVRAAA